MSFFPHFSINIANAFWFSLLFWISNLIVLWIYPSHYKTRVLKMPTFQKRFQKIVGTFNFCLFQGLIIMVIFMPIEFHTSHFAIGLVVFCISFVVYLLSLINYATSNPERPVTKGIYKLSRNPQQISTILMWIGIGFLTDCSLIIALCVFQLITVYPTFKAQESFCVEKYGNEYQDYMKRTPRYFLYL